LSLGDGYLEKSDADENSHREDWQANTLGSGPVNGIVLATTPYVSIQWPWLMFLGLELLLAAAFLLAIIMNTMATRTRILKGSSLATLCALDDATRQQLGHVGDLEELQYRAEKMSVILERCPDGISLRMR
jgi:hypothetical protein